MTVEALGFQGDTKAAQEFKLLGGRTMREMIEGYCDARDTKRVLSTPLSADCKKLGYNYGCASSHGTKEKSQHKGIEVEHNEDFAFSVEIDNNLGEKLLCSGIADGVSNSTWSAIGAHLASDTFIFAAHSLKDEFPDPENLSARENFVDKFIQIFLKRWNILTDEARKIIDEKNDSGTYKHLPLDYAPDFYQRHKDSGRLLFFQTTLAGVIMGPKGGFLLNLSDGLGRVVRRYSEGRRVVAPIPPIGKKLVEGAQEFQGQTYFMSLNDVSQIEVVLASDGLGDLAIEDQIFDGSSDCAKYLDALILANPNGVSGSIPDNMSIAFSSWKKPEVPPTSQVTGQGAISLAKKSKVSPTPVEPLSSPKKISLAKRS